MQFLVHTGRDETIDPAVVMAGLAAEIAGVKRLYTEGLIRQIWHRADRPGAIILCEARSREAAEAGLATLPLMKAGAVITESIVEQKPYAGFAP